MLNERQENTLAGKLLSALCTIVLIILVALTIFNLWFVNVYFVVEVDGTSMCDTFQNGDLLYAKKRFFTAERGDVVIIDVEDYHLFQASTKRVIKRLIAVEGDCVKCEDGVVFLKKAGGEYEALDEPYVNAVTEDFGEVVVGAGEIFFIGDNRHKDASKDSRSVGCLKYTDIIGVVPEWAIRHKDFSTRWERERGTLITG